MTVQKLKPRIDSEFETARRYYQIISDVNKLELKNMELNLLAFIAVKGFTNNKEVFCTSFGSSLPSMYNMVNRLSKKKLLYKENKKIKILPAIALNFKEPVILKITLNAETPEQGS